LPNRREKNNLNFMPQKKSKNKIFAIGLGKERDYIVENLSMLITAGMPILNVLDTIKKELRSHRMKKIIALIKEDIENGLTIWKALQKTGMFAHHIVSLIRLGEESGKLMENLQMVSTEQEKDRIFKSKINSAIMYPIFVLSLTIIIGTGISLFILPRLAMVFNQLDIELPLITKILMGTGTFLGNYGQYVLPLIIILIALLFFFIFSFSKTKFMGQAILFTFPGIKNLVKEVEVARFGYLLGTLLKAGIPINTALDSLAGATDIVQYRALYKHIRESMENGDTFQKSFDTFKNTKKLIPNPIQQLVIIGEKSGSLSETLTKIGRMFEAKSDITTKNLTVIFEPILLVIVWLGVVAVALAIILPIYSLIGGFKA
jgi:type IV pilus assembly protein PilC